MSPASVFISYAHTDNESNDPSKRWLDRLKEHLEPLNFQEQVHTWSDRDTEFGANWHSSIQMSLSNARAAVLLISPAFLASKYIRNSELPVLLKNASDKGLVIIPIILRPSLFRETLFKYPDPHSGPEEISLASLQAANSPTRPLNSLEEHAQDEVLLSVAQRLLRIVQIPVSKPKTIELTESNFMSPTTTLAAGTIVGLAFSEFIKSGAGELAKKSVGGAIDLIKNLRNKIEIKFRGSERAEKALVEVKQQGTQAALEKVTKYLDVEMMEDEAFATEVQQIAQQIINIQKQNISTRQFNNYGRDQIGIVNMGSISSDTPRDIENLTIESIPSDTPRNIENLTIESIPSDTPRGIEKLTVESIPRVTPRFLQADVPERAKLGDRFTLLVRIVLANNGTGSSQLRSFNVPAQGIDVKITVTGSAFAVVSESTQMLHVPADADSDPLLFELEARQPGVQKLEILVFNAGAFLGSHAVQVNVGNLRTEPPVRQSGLIHARNANEGETTLTVKYDLERNRYRYVLRSQTIGETDDILSGPLTRPREDLIRDFVETLNTIARGGVSLSPSAARVLLEGKGKTLWNEMIPPELQRTFWEHRESIKQLRIICGPDPIPWEVLYPTNDDGMGKGFLAEQFPVTRWRPGSPAPLNLQVSQPLFVLPDNSPAQAQDEIANLKRRLKGGHLVEQLDALLFELKKPRFNVLHFACHNTFVADKPLASYINMNGSPFVPDMVAGIGKSLRTRSPLVFMNACRTAGSAPTYTQLSGWADKFLDAGAAAFIGSLWEIRDSSAPRFAESVYDSLLRPKATLGESVWESRKAIQEDTGDPTWLAYALYGNPDATVE